MTKVEIENFQSIKKVNFDIDGFTVIVGKNNIGKSALIRAVDSAISNAAGKSFIRNGTKESKVSIVREGLDLTWKKSESSSYEINGEKFSKLNRSIPEPLLKAGFKKMDIGDAKINPLVASQFNELFLLDKTGGTITDVLSAMYKLNIISTADDMCRKELRSSKSLLKTRDLDLELLSERLKKFKGFEEIQDKMVSIKKRDKQSKTLESDIEEIEEFQAGVKRSENLIKELKVFSKLKIPGHVKHEKSLKNFEDISRMSNALIEVKESLKGLAPAKNLKIPPTLPLKKGLESFVETEEMLSSYTKKGESYTRNKTMLDGLVSVGGFLKKIKEMSKIFEDARILIKSYKEIKSSISNIKETKKDYEVILNDLSQLEEKVGEFDLCPSCGKPV